MIAAMSKDGLIGKDNALPWHLPEELKYFRTVTKGKPVIMGRKTFESIGMPLPNRHNIILTHHKNFKAEGCTIAHSTTEAIEAAKINLPHFQNNTALEEIMIIGGAKIYELFLPLANRLYITIVEGEFTGDTFFPKIKWDEWKLNEEDKKPEFTTQVWDRKA